MSHEEPQDRRAHPRYSTNLNLHVMPEEGGVTARMVANNLSMGGLYCVSGSDFPEMTRLAVRLLLPDGRGANGDPEPIDLEAVVVRRRQLPSATGQPRFELGLFFTQVSQNARDKLRRFIQ